MKWVRKDIDITIFNIWFKWLRVLRGHCTRSDLGPLNGLLLFNSCSGNMNS